MTIVYLEKCFVKCLTRNFWSSEYVSILFQFLLLQINFILFQSSFLVIVYLGLQFYFCYFNLNYFEIQFGMIYFYSFGEYGNCLFSDFIISLYELLLLPSCLTFNYYFCFNLDYDFFNFNNFLFYFILPVLILNFLLHLIFYA